MGLDAEHIGLKKAQETINSDIFWRIPNDYRSMAEARNNGVPLSVQAPKAAITQAVTSLAAALNGEGGDESEEMADGDKKAGVSKWLPFLGNKSGT